MDKATALQKATDAVTVLSVAVSTYGDGSPEANGACEAVRDSFVVARAHGATDDDLRATHTG